MMPILEHFDGGRRIAVTDCSFWGEMASFASKDDFY